MNLPFSHPEKGGDPSSEYDVRPMVAIRRQDRSVWWFAGGALIAAVLLFSALEARRQGTEQAEDRAAAGTSFAAPEAVPDLVVPTLPLQSSPGLISRDGWPQPGDQPRRNATPGLQPQPRPVINQPTYRSQLTYSDNAYQVPPSPYPNEPGGSAPAFEAPSPPATRAATGTNRVMAGRLENPSTTVIQGTLINAVLETALDSTRPGQTRAVVTRDVYGFDGKRLLIPRGTRLYGSYEADVAQGQKRAQIRWARLLRPDGVSVALDSPAADPLGRAGVAGKVNSHFLQRLGNALVGTTANIGSALVTRSIAPTSPVVVAVPGATQSVSQSVTPTSTQIAPTLTVRQGTRITVFVQHDLDFTSVEEAP
jgi:type IV secretion system protein VirB10